MADWIIDSPDQSSSPESFGQQAKRVGISSGVKSLETVQNLANLLFKNAPQPAEYVKQQFGLTPEYLEPRGGTERFIQRFSQGAIPSALLGGLPGLAVNALGSGVSTAAGELGAPEALQDVLQLGTEIGAGRVGTKIPGIGGLLEKTKIPSVREVQKIEYNLAKAAAEKNLPAKANSIMDALHATGNALELETDPKTHKAITHALESVGKNISSGKINPAKAMELRKNLYRQSKRLDKSVAASYIEPLTKGINNFFTEYAAENPTFFKHLKTADKLTELRHMNSYVADFIKTADLPKIPGGRLLEAIGSYLIGNTEKISRSLLTNPAAQKYAFNAVKSAAKNDPLTVIKNAQNIIELIPGIPSRIKQELIPNDTGWVIE